jgi:hypothetical protein
MESMWRLTSLLLICWGTLTACAAPLSPAAAPTITPTPHAVQQAVEAATLRADRVELAAGRYQLIMFYSPI